jgi:hypothetical protein
MGTGDFSRPWKFPPLFFPRLLNPEVDQLVVYLRRTKLCVHKAAAPRRALQFGGRGVAVPLMATSVSRRLAGTAGADSKAWKKPSEFIQGLEKSGWKIPRLGTSGPVGPPCSMAAVNAEPPAACKPENFPAGNLTMCTHLHIVPA